MFLLTFKAARPSAMPYLAWIGLLYMLGNPVFAQYFSDKLLFQHLGPQQGLPQNWGWAIEQDREGFMWFGNQDGVYKFDGYWATRYGFNPSDVTHSLRSNLIGAIHEDRKGRLWIATWGGGLHQMDKRTGRATAYPVEDKQLSQWDQQNDIYEDKQGMLWISTFGGIARFDPDKHIYSLYATPNKEGTNQLQVDARGKIWSGSYQFDPETEKYTLYPLLTPNGSQLIAPIGFNIDSEGMAWMGIEGGLYHLDTRNPHHYTLYAARELINKSIIRVKSLGDLLLVGTTQGLVLLNKRTHEILTYQSNSSNPGSLSNDFVSSIYLDRTGNLWLNTQNGVNMASTRKELFQVYQIIPTPASFHHLENEIFSVVEDTTKTIWVSSAGHGLYRMNPATHHFSPVELNPLNKHRAKLRSAGWPLLEDRQGQLWIGASDEKGLYQLDRSTGIFIHYDCQIAVRLLDTDASGRIWIATAGGVGKTVASFDPLTKKFTYYQADEKDSTGLLTGFYNDIMVSRRGEVWLATSMGISRMNPKTSRSIRYQPDYYSSTNALIEPHVMALYEDEQGNIWIGTHGGGLNRLDPNTNTFTYFTTKDGLPSNRIMSITGDHKGNIWLGTGNGLSRFNPNTNTFHNFDKSDGLPGSEFLERGNTFRRDGKIYFGNKDGLVVFYPDSIKDDSATFPVYITGLTVLEENRPLPEDTLELPYDENFLSLTFAALNYTSPEKTRYTYQLKGVDKQWVQAGKQRTARYTDLAPGRYTFRVKATTDAQVWNGQEASLTIHIRPPFWRTAWAYGFYGLCLFAAVFAVDRIQRRRLIAREREKARERELEQARELEKAYHALGQKSQELLQHKEELESTLEHLKSTQEQLIEQEKAALENKHKLERAAYENKFTQLEMQALRAQMNPHFIFNCLNSINRFILKNESESASDYLTKFSKLIRLILQNSQSQAVPLENELEALRLYMDMEVLRFEGQVEYTIITHLDLETEEIEVPPLIIQPYVENAIWHGLMHKGGKGHIQIHLQQEGQLLVCIIEDDGIGRKRAAELKSKSATKKKSLGMQITSHRLALINALSEKETTVAIVDVVDTAGESCGTKVIVKIPI